MCGYFTSLEGNSQTEEKQNPKHHETVARLATIRHC
jgi:hypothetical protein